MLVTLHSTAARAASRTGAPFVPLWIACPDSLPPSSCAGLKKVKASPLCSLPSMLRVKFLVLDQRVGVAVGLDADHDERRIERRLGHPVHRRRRYVALPVVGGQHIDAIGNHAQGGFLGVLVHRLSSACVEKSFCVRLYIATAREWQD